MKKILAFILILLICPILIFGEQNWDGDNWYDNKLKEYGSNLESSKSHIDYEHWNHPDKPIYPGYVDGENHTGRYYCDGDGSYKIEGANDHSYRYQPELTIFQNDDGEYKSVYIQNIDKDGDGENGIWSLRSCWIRGGTVKSESRFASSAFNSIISNYGGHDGYLVAQNSTLMGLNFCTIEGGSVIVNNNASRPLVSDGKKTDRAKRENCIYINDYYTAGVKSSLVKGGYLEVKNTNGNGWGIYRSKISGGTTDSHDNKIGFKKSVIDKGTLNVYLNSSHGITGSTIKGSAVVNAYKNKTATGIRDSTIKKGTVRSYNNGYDSSTNKYGSGYGFFRDVIEGGNVYTCEENGKVGNQYGFYSSSISGGNIYAVYNTQGVIGGTISGGATVKIHDNSIGITQVGNKDYITKTHLKYTQIKGGIVYVYSNKDKGIVGASISNNAKVYVYSNTNEGIKSATINGGVVKSSSNKEGITYSTISDGEVTAFSNKSSGITHSVMSKGKVTVYSNDSIGITDSVIEKNAVVNAYNHKKGDGKGIVSTDINGGNITSYNNTINIDLTGKKIKGSAKVTVYGEGATGIQKGTIEKGTVYTYKTKTTTGNKIGINYGTITGGKIYAKYNTQNALRYVLIDGNSAEVYVENNDGGSDNEYYAITHSTITNVKKITINNNYNGINEGSIGENIKITVIGKEKGKGTGIYNTNLTESGINITVQKQEKGINLDNAHKINNGNIYVYDNTNGIVNGSITGGTVYTYDSDKNRTANTTGISDVCIGGGTVYSKYNTNIGISNGSIIDGSVTVSNNGKDRGDAGVKGTTITGGKVNAFENIWGFNGVKIEGGEVNAYQNTSATGIGNSTISSGTVRSYQNGGGNGWGYFKDDISGGEVYTYKDKKGNYYGVYLSTISGGNLNVWYSTTGVAGGTIKDGAVVDIQNNKTGIGKADNENYTVEYALIEGGNITLTDNHIGINSGTVSGGNININSGWRALNSTLVDGSADIEIKGHMHYGTEGDASTIWYTVDKAIIKDFNSFKMVNNYNGIHNSILNANNIEIIGRGQGLGSGIKNSSVTCNITISSQSRGIFYQKYTTDKEGGSVIGGWDNKIISGSITISTVVYGIYTAPNTPKDKIQGSSITIYNAKKDYSSNNNAGSGVYNTDISGGKLDISICDYGINTSLISGDNTIVKVYENTRGIKYGTINISSTTLTVSKNTIGIDTSTINKYVKVEGEGKVGIQNSSITVGAEVYNVETAINQGTILGGSVYTYDTSKTYTSNTSNINKTGIDNSIISGGTIYAKYNDTAIYGSEISNKIIYVEHNNIGITTTTISGGKIYVSSNSSRGIQYSTINNGNINVNFNDKIAITSSTINDGVVYVSENKANGIMYSTITGGSVTSAYNGIFGYAAGDPYDKDGFTYCTITGGTITAKGNSSQGFHHANISNALVYVCDNINAGIWQSTITSGEIYVYKNGTDDLGNDTSGIKDSTIRGGTIHTYDNCPLEHSIQYGTIDSIGIDGSFIIGKTKNDKSSAVIVSSGNNVGIKNSYINGGTISLKNNNTKRNVTGDTVSRSITGSTILNSSMTIEATPHTLQNNKVGLQKSDNNIFEGGNNIWIKGFEVGLTGGDIRNSTVTAMGNDVGIKLTSLSVLSMDNSFLTSSNYNKIGLLTTGKDLVVKIAPKGNDFKGIVLNPESTIDITKNFTGVQIENGATLILEEIAEIRNVIVENNDEGIKTNNSGTITIDKKSDMSLTGNTVTIISTNTGIVNIKGESKVNIDGKNIADGVALKAIDHGTINILEKSNVNIENNKTGILAENSGTTNILEKSAVTIENNKTGILATGAGIVNIKGVRAGTNVGGSSITIKGGDLKEIESYDIIEKTKTEIVRTDDDKIIEEHLKKYSLSSMGFSNENLLRTWAKNGYINMQYKYIKTDEQIDELLSKYSVEDIYNKYKILLSNLLLNVNTVPQLQFVDYCIKEKLIIEKNGSLFYTKKFFDTRDIDDNIYKFYKELGVITIDGVFTKEGLYSETLNNTIKDKGKDLWDLLDLYTEKETKYKVEVPVTKPAETFGIYADIANGGRVNIDFSEIYVNNISSVGIYGANITDSYVEIESATIAASRINKQGEYEFRMEYNDIGLKGTGGLKNINSILKNNGVTFDYILNNYFNGKWGNLSVKDNKEKEDIKAALLLKSYIDADGSVTANGLAMFSIYTDKNIYADEKIKLEYNVNTVVNGGDIIAKENRIGIDGTEGNVTIIGSILTIEGKGKTSKSESSGIIGKGAEIIDCVAVNISSHSLVGIQEATVRNSGSENMTVSNNTIGLKEANVIGSKVYVIYNSTGIYGGTIKDKSYIAVRNNDTGIYGYGNSKNTQINGSEIDIRENKTGIILDNNTLNLTNGILTLVNNGNDKERKGISAGNNSTINISSMAVTSTGNDMVYLTGNSKLNITASTVTLTKADENIISTGIVVNGGTSAINFKDNSLVTFGNGDIETLVNVEKGIGTITVDNSRIEGDIIGAGTKNVTLINNSKWYIKGESKVNKLESNTGNNYIVLVATGKLVGNLTITNEFTGNLKLDTEDLGYEGNKDSILAVNLQDATVKTGKIDTDGKINLGAFTYSLEEENNIYYLKKSGSNSTAKLASKVPGITNAVVTAGLNSLTRRLGDIRRTPQDKLNGVWTRVYGRNDKFTKDIETKMEMTGAEGGYDRQVMTDKTDRYYVGAMVGYQNINKIETKQKAGSKQSGEGTAPSAGVYGTWIAENGLFADITVRNFWISLDMNNTVKGCKPYRNQVAVSGEFGKEFKVYSGSNSTVVIEPKTEWVYSYAGSASSKQMEYGATNSIKGKVGFMLGLNAQTTGGINWQPYIEAGYSYEFDNKTEVRYLAYKATEDLSGGYGDVGIGLNAYLGKGFSGYSLVSYEKGSDQENFVYNVGFRYGF